MNEPFTATLQPHRMFFSHQLPQKKSDLLIKSNSKKCVFTHCQGNDKASRHWLEYKVHYHQATCEVNFQSTNEKKERSFFLVFTLFFPARNGSKKKAAESTVIHTCAAGYMLDKEINLKLLFLKRPHLGQRWPEANHYRRLIISPFIRRSLFIILRQVHFTTDVSPVRVINSDINSSSSEMFRSEERLNEMVNGKRINCEKSPAKKKNFTRAMICFPRCLI